MTANDEVRRSDVRGKRPNAPRDPGDEALDALVQAAADAPVDEARTARAVMRRIAHRRQRRWRLPELPVPSPSMALASLVTALLIAGLAGYLVPVPGAEREIAALALGDLGWAPDGPAVLP